MLRNAINAAATVPAGHLPEARRRWTAPAAMRPDYWQADAYNPVRLLGVNFALFFIFFRFSLLHEVMTVTFGTNAYILYISGITAILALILSGGLHRAFQSRLSWYWLGFVACLIPATIFSAWRAHSIIVVMAFLRTDVIVLFMFSGLILTWTEFWRVVHVLAAAAVFDIWVGRHYANLADARMSLDIGGGSLSDPNDLAAHLLLLLPFLLLITLTPGRLIFARLIAIGGLFFGLYVTLSTGSRGGLISLLIITLYAITQLPARYRLVLLVAIPLTGVFFAAALPHAVRFRLLTTFSGNAAVTSDEDVEVQSAASGSAASRLHLLKQALVLTLKHPLVGVGPGEFADAEGSLARLNGQHGAWHETHNTYAQVSSETGIPSLIFFMAALVSTYRVLRRVRKMSLQQPPTLQNRRIAVTAFCLMLSMLVFCTAIFFLSFAYKFYLPALSGIAIAFARAAEHEWGLPQPNAVNPRTALL